MKRKCCYRWYNSILLGGHFKVATVEYPCHRLINLHSGFKSKQSRAVSFSDPSITYISILYTRVSYSNQKHGLHYSRDPSGSSPSTCTSTSRSHTGRASAMNHFCCLVSIISVFPSLSTFQTYTGVSLVSVHAWIFNLSWRQASHCAIKCSSIKFDPRENKTFSRECHLLWVGTKCILTTSQSV